MNRLTVSQALANDGAAVNDPNAHTDGEDRSLPLSEFFADAARQTPTMIPAMKPDVSNAFREVSFHEVWRKAVAALRARWYLRRAQLVGPHTRVWGRPSIQCAGRFVVGDRVQFVSTIAQLEIVVGEGSTLDIGDDVFINYGTSISANHHIRIGAGSMLGMYVLLMDNNFHHLDPARRLERPESFPIVLEENVWLAARVTVLPGVTIGKNSVIGAGSVVTKDIPPQVLAAGVPAKVIKQL